MIGYLQGTILEVEPGALILAVGSPQSAGRVGYSLRVPQSAAYASLSIAESVELFVHTHVREDVLELFGFLTREEKIIFRVCQQVSGIGPKAALGILSGGSPQSILEAVLEGDKEFFVSIPGVGKKTAERLVLELKDPVKKIVETGKLTARPATQRFQSGGAVSALQGAGELGRHAFSDAKKALLGLGYRDAEVDALLRQVVSEGAAPEKTEDLIRAALKQLSL